MLSGPWSKGFLRIVTVCSINPSPHPATTRITISKTSHFR